jgi:hypothetical protein
MRCFGMPCVGVMPTLLQCHRLRSFIPYGHNLRQFVVDDSGWTVWWIFKLKNLFSVFCLDSTVVVLITWPQEPCAGMRAHRLLFVSPYVLVTPIIWCRHHTHAHCYLRPPDVKAIFANLAGIMTLNDVRHDLLPSIIAWDYYMKNVCITFLILELLLMESRRESCWPVRRFYRSCV